MKFIILVLKVMLQFLLSRQNIQQTLMQLVLCGC